MGLNIKSRGNCKIGFIIFRIIIVFYIEFCIWEYIIISTIKIINRIILTQPISTLQKLQDTWLTTKVDSQVITQGKLDPDDLKVVTENNTVYLIGSLKRAQANQVINMAKNTDGVQHVVTLIYYLEPKTA